MKSASPVSPVLHYLAFDVQNHGTLMLQQTAGVNHAVKVYTEYPQGPDDLNAITIEPGDMVMLVNLYRYIKRNDIQNDFINPHGKNREVRCPLCGAELLQQGPAFRCPSCRAAFSGSRSRAE